MAKLPASHQVGDAAAKKVASRKKPAGTAKQTIPRPGARVAKAPPKSGRALTTYELLLSTAGELLGEIGFEKLTTNAICARANLTPPALYRYFSDKYEILEELGRRLLKRQFDSYAVWLFQGGTWAKESSQVDKLEEWFRIARRGRCGSTRRRVDDPGVAGPAQPGACPPRISADVH